jgi:hypothetical protein
MFISGQSHADRRAGRGVLARVAHQVGQHLVQPVLVAADQDRVTGQVKPPVMLAPGHPRVAGHVDGQPGQVDRLALERTPGVQPGQQQQVVDQHAHPGRLGLHPGQRVGHVLGHRAAVPQGQLRVAADRGQGSAQLV